MPSRLKRRQYDTRTQRRKSLEQAWQSKAAQPSSSPKPSKPSVNIRASSSALTQSDAPVGPPWSEGMSVGLQSAPPKSRWSPKVVNAIAAGRSRATAHHRKPTRQRHSLSPSRRGPSQLPITPVMKMAASAGPYPAINDTKSGTVGPMKPRATNA